MNNKISKSEVSFLPIKDHSQSKSMIVSSVKTSRFPKKRNNLTLNLIFSDAYQQLDKKMDPSEDLMKDKNSSAFCLGLLIWTALTFAAGFGIGWWCANFNPDLSAGKLDTEPFVETNL